MCRAPVRRQVKTRLIPSLGSARATRVQRELIRGTLANVSGGHELDVQLWTTPTIRHADFLRLARQYGCRRHVQPTGGLGQKMSGIFSSLLRQYSGVIIVGADCPAIDVELIRQVHSALEGGAELFLGATEDGGYALIGMKQVRPALFRAMPWGGSRVCRLTMQRARQQGMNVSVKEGLWDVDTPADFRRWQRHLRGQGKAWVV